MLWSKLWLKKDIAGIFTGSGRENRTQKILPFISVSIGYTRHGWFTALLYSGKKYLTQQTSAFSLHLAHALLLFQLQTKEVLQLLGSSRNHVLVDSLFNASIPENKFCACNQKRAWWSFFSEHEVRSHTVKVYHPPKWDCHIQPCWEWYMCQLCKAQLWIVSRFSLEFNIDYYRTVILLTI